MDKQNAFFLQYLPLTITLVALEESLLPAYLGSTIRGVIGQALRDHPTALAYLYRNQSVEGDRKDTVNPYIIIPPPAKDTAFQQGEMLSFHMLLIGDATRYATPLINALLTVRQFGVGAARHRFSLVKITHSLNQRVIGQNGHINTVALEDVVLPFRNLPQVTGLTIRLLTPLRIRRNGVILELIDFPTIIRNIVRRITALTERYGGRVDIEEAERLLTKSTQITLTKKSLTLKKLNRYSNRLSETVDCSGLVGSMCFSGDLTPFVPWLYAAEILHIGRNTTFGLGQIEVEFI